MLVEAYNNLDEAFENLQSYQESADVLDTSGGIYVSIDSAKKEFIKALNNESLLNQNKNEIIKVKKNFNSRNETANFCSTF